VSCAENLQLSRTRLPVKSLQSWQQVRRVAWHGQRGSGAQSAAPVPRAVHGGRAAHQDLVTGSVVRGVALHAGRLAYEDTPPTIRRRQGVQKPGVYWQPRESHNMCSHDCFNGGPA
jgi:hypothetical protein